MPTKTPDGPATALLERLLAGVAAKRVSEFDALFADDVVAVVPAADPSGSLDKAELVSWLETLCESTGTMRLDLGTTISATSDSVGAVVTHTAFRSPPGDGPPVDPYWYSVPTIVAANSDASGETLQRLFFVTDDAEQPNRTALVGAVEAWFGAYMNQDLEGFLDALADDFVGVNYNGYQSSAPVTKPGYRTGYEQWMARNLPGGFVIGASAARGSHVAVAVQFLTIARETGQQKMTHEIHIIDLDDSRKLRRAYFYETDRCGYPDSPCEW